MSSNMYGFTCNIPVGERDFHVQIVYKGTEGDSEESLEYATGDWETTDPVALAQYELDHREWEQEYHGEARLIVMGIYGGWLDEDPAKDPTWNPPTPTDREVLEAIANGLAIDIVHGWDT